MHAGNLGIMPTRVYPEPSVLLEYGYKSLFSHDEESAAPGLYSVMLQVCSSVNAMASNLM
jgi:hypothetical protein